MGLTPLKCWEGVWQVTQTLSVGQPLPGVSSHTWYYQAVLPDAFCSQHKCRCHVEDLSSICRWQGCSPLLCSGHPAPHNCDIIRQIVCWLLIACYYFLCYNFLGFNPHPEHLGQRGIINKYQGRKEWEGGWREKGIKSGGPREFISVSRQQMIVYCGTLLGKKKTSLNLSF